jgi:DNA-binding NarL/FixJ family response regulator
MREASTLIVEPNALFREGLSRILRAARFRILSTVPLLDLSVLEASADQENLLLLIGSGGDAHSVAEQIELFKTRHNAGRVAVVADAYRPSDVLTAFRAGANAYFFQGTPCDAFIRSLDLVMLGQTFMPAEMLPFLLGSEDKAPAPIAIEPSAAVALVERAGARNLSAQEKRILHYLIEGDSNKIIARKIDIAEATVKAHIKAILRKIQVQNRTQAAIWAMHNGSFNSAPGNGLERKSAIGIL